MTESVILTHKIDSMVSVGVRRLKGDRYNCCVVLLSLILYSEIMDHHHVSFIFGAHSLSGPVHYYEIGSSIAVLCNTQTLTLIL